jgi:hypothetical protein
VNMQILNKSGFYYTLCLKRNEIIFLIFILLLPRNYYKCNKYGIDRSKLDNVCLFMNDEMKAIKSTYIPTFFPAH